MSNLGFVPLVLIVQFNNTKRASLSRFAFAVRQADSFRDIFYCCLLLQNAHVNCPLMAAFLLKLAR